MSPQHPFPVVESSIQSHLSALSTGATTSVSLTLTYLHRISTYDVAGPTLNTITVLNPNALAEARASDAHRASGLPPRPLEGIPYTLKDSYKYTGLTASVGSPAFKDLLSNSDSHVAAKLRAAGAVLLGKTNMPPMAAGGMQRGLYGRAESPYNLEYLTAAFSSGSSNGAASATAASFAVFGLGSETVSSGRSAASNNGLVAYTPSRGVISCRGLWPLYGTCDVVVPYARSVEDMVEVLKVICERDEVAEGDFWREQQFVKLDVPKMVWKLERKDLRGKRIGVPRMYVGAGECGKPVFVADGVVKLWEQARKDLEELGAEVVLTDCPLVTNYEDDSVSGQANNVVGAPSNWNSLERGLLVAKVWDRFLKECGHPGLGEVDGNMMFPKPENYIPDTFGETKNFMDYVGLTRLARDHPESIWDIPGMREALTSLEAQRKRDFEDWMDERHIDFVVFPAQGDVGKADLEENVESSRHALQNGVKYSNGNRAIRHLGVPTISVAMGPLETGMPVNLTFAAKAYDDVELLNYAYVYEQGSKRRTRPTLTPELEALALGGKMTVKCEGRRICGTGDPKLYVNGKEIEPTNEGKEWEVVIGLMESKMCPKGRMIGKQTIVMVIGQTEDGNEDGACFAL